MGVLKFEQVIEFTVINCGECDVQVAMPTAVYERKVREKGGYFCLNGHSRRFVGETEAQKLAKQLESERASKEWWQKKADQHSKTASAFKGQVTRIKNRVGNGVCPCCNRTFQNLQRHMCTKHPEYKSAEVKETDE